MSTYRTLKGQLIKKVSEDPTNPVEGQIWYNTTTGLLKGLPALLAWSSTGNTINTHGNGVVGIGTQPAGLLVGGSPYMVQAEEFDGTVYSAGGDTNTGRVYGGGAGTQTAGLYFGGGKSPGSANAGETEEYNGTSWSEQNDMNTARQQLTGCGTQTAGLAAAGYDNTVTMDDTEEYDGTSWTSGNNTPEGVLQGNMVGTQTSAYFFGGATNTPGSAVTSSSANYDGTNWTAVSTPVVTARRLAGAAGTATDCIFFGGFIPPGTGATEQYDGISWVTTPATLVNQNRAGGSFGTSSAAVFAGGTAHPPGSATTASEAFNRSVDVVLGGAWASANNSNTLSEGPASFGTKAGLVSVGGYGPSGPSNAHSDAVEEYDGTNWTTATAYPTNVYSGQGGGTLTAGIVSGGNSGGATFINNSTTYNGSSWTAAPTLNSARDGTASSLGTQTAALHVGGYDPTVRAYTEEFNGSSWSEQNDMSTARTRGGTAGTQTAALYFNGESTNSGPIPSRIPNTTEEYNGTSWTAGGTVPERFTRLNGSGTQNNAYRIGGSTGSAVVATTDFYNGTSWSSSDNLISAQNWANSGGSGFSDSIIGRGRGSSTYTAVTQEYTRPSGTEKNVKTITSST